MTGTVGTGVVDGNELRSKLNDGVSGVIVANDGVAVKDIEPGVSINGELRDKLYDADECNDGGMEIELILRELDSVQFIDGVVLTDRVSDGVSRSVGTADTDRSADRDGDISMIDGSTDKAAESTI